MLELAVRAWRLRGERAAGELEVLRRQLRYPLQGADIGQNVETLAAAGIETFESCQGGEGHSMPEPTFVRFHGERGEGLRALAVALQGELPGTGQ